LHCCNDARCYNAVPLMGFAFLDRLWLCVYHICYLVEYILCLVVLFDVLF
jgi:hypothetical protein